MPPVANADLIAAFPDHCSERPLTSLVLARVCLWKQKNNTTATVNTPIADPTPTPALVPAERPDFEPWLLFEGELVADELVAVADRFEDDVDRNVNDTEEVTGENVDVGAIVDVEREMNLSFLGATPSQTNAKELKATSARHSPTKLASPSRRLFARIFFTIPGLGSSSVGSAVQFLLS